MKLKTTFMLLLGASAALASAQNVIVVMNDGTTHKFNADYLKEIKFQDAAAEIPVIDFPAVEVEPFGNGNVTVTLSDAAGDKFVLDLYGPMNEPWLHSGIYALDPTKSPFTIDPAYSSLKVGDASGTPVEGTAVITLDDRQYTIEATLKLESGQEFSGKYVGEIPTYTQWLVQKMSAASYSSNDQPRGNYYVKLNDPDWKYEMAVVLIADSDAEELPVGTYIYSDDLKPGSVAPNSFVNCFRPNANLHLEQGSFVVVEKEGDNYTLTMNLNLTDGRVAEFSYEGKISGTPKFVTPVADTITFDSAEVGDHFMGDVMITLSNTSGDIKVELNCYCDVAAKYFPSGVYVVDGSDETHFIAAEYSSVEKGGQTLGITGGSMTVSHDDSVYTMACDLVLSDGTQLKGEYVGELNDFGYPGE